MKALTIFISSLIALPTFAAIETRLVVEEKEDGTVKSATLVTVDSDEKKVINTSSVKISAPVEKEQFTVMGANNAALLSFGLRQDLFATSNFRLTGEVNSCVLLPIVIDGVGMHLRFNPTGQRISFGPTMLRTYILSRASDIAFSDALAMALTYKSKSGLYELQIGKKKTNFRASATDTSGRVENFVGLVWGWK